MSFFGSNTPRYCLKVDGKKYEDPMLTIHVIRALLRYIEFHGGYDNELLWNTGTFYNLSNQPLTKQTEIEADKQVQVLLEMLYNIVNEEFRAKQFNLALRNEKIDAEIDNNIQIPLLGSRLLKTTQSDITVEVSFFIKKIFKCLGFSSGDFSKLTGQVKIIEEVDINQKIPGQVNDIVISALKKNPKYREILPEYISHLQKYYVTILRTKGDESGEFLKSLATNTGSTFFAYDPKNYGPAIFYYLLRYYIPSNTQTIGKILATRKKSTPIQSLQKGYRNYGQRRASRNDIQKYNKQQQQMYRQQLQQGNPLSVDEEEDSNQEGGKIPPSLVKTGQQIKKGSTKAFNYGVKQTKKGSKQALNYGVQQSQKGIKYGAKQIHKELKRTSPTYFAFNEARKAHKEAYAPFAAAKKASKQKEMEAREAIRQEKLAYENKKNELRRQSREFKKSQKADAWSQVQALQEHKKAQRLSAQQAMTPAQEEIVQQEQIQPSNLYNFPEQQPQQPQSPLYDFSKWNPQQGQAGGSYSHKYMKYKQKYLAEKERRGHKRY